MQEPTFTHSIVAVRTQNARIARFLTRAALAFIMGPVVIAIVAGIADALGWKGLGDLALDAWLFCWLVGTPVTTLGAILAAFRRGQRGKQIDVDPEALHLSDDRGVARIVRRADIRGALHVAGDRHEVELVLGSDDLLHLELDSPGGARRLIEALGFGATERRTVVLLGDSQDSIAAGCWGVLLGVLATLFTTCGVALAPWHVIQQLAGYLIGLVFIGSSLLFTRLLTPKRLVIGTDGVVIEGGLGKRFVPLQSITDVGGTRQGIVLRLGEHGEIPLNTLRHALGSSLVDRLQEALAAARSATAESPTTLIARGGRSLGDWREALRKLVGSGDYRGERVSADALLRAAESADAPLDQRLGAAMAIGLGDDVTAKARLRIAVEGIANENLRAAMEAAAEGAEEAAAIEEALAEEERVMRR